LDNNSNAEVVIVLDARKVNYMFPELHFRFWKQNPVRFR
jgi:hypothetical protein